jgi:hypothetical protein
MSVEPAALQLRLLQTVVEVAAEKNSTLILPFPVELLRFLERSTPEKPEKAGTEDKPAADSETPQLTAPKVPDDASGIQLNGPAVGHGQNA